MGTTRRAFLGWWGSATASALALGVMGCGDASRTTDGVLVENPPDIQEALDRSAAGYATVDSKKKKKRR